MRGENQADERFKELRGWLIPACAGKTRAWPQGRVCAGAHPRMRGENLPLARKGHRAGWLIPACAGKTPKSV